MTTTKTPRGTGPSSANPPSPIVDGFALTGPSHPPDPAFHAYRQDLADTALAGRVIASHYAEPLARTIMVASGLFASPSDSGEPIGRVESGDDFAMLDSTRGWAWGYAGKDRRVGYVQTKSVGAA